MATMTAENLGFPWATGDPFLFCVHHLDFFIPREMAEGDLQTHSEVVKSEMI